MAAHNERTCCTTATKFSRDFDSIEKKCNAEIVVKIKNSVTL